MMTRYEAWLDKKSLSAIDSAIYIRDIAYNAPRFAITTSSIPGRNGQRIASRHAQSTGVTITIEIHEQDIAKRQEICQRVQAWAAKGGSLTTNDRRGQRLRVICETPPVIASALKWTQTIKMLFTAYEHPFWEDEHPRSVMLNGSDAKGWLYAPGNGAVTCVEASIRNASGGTIDALTLKAGGTTFNFESLALGQGETLTIDYDEYGLLRIQTEAASKMNCRSADSDDDLLIETGKAEEMAVVATGDVNVQFKARGLYL